MYAQSGRGRSQLAPSRGPYSRTSSASSLIVSTCAHVSPARVALDTVALTEPALTDTLSAMSRCVRLSTHFCLRISFT
jgi:hypothetical protein